MVFNAPLRNCRAPRTKLGSVEIVSICSTALAASSSASALALLTSARRIGDHVGAFPAARVTVNDAIEV